MFATVVLKDQTKPRTMRASLAQVLELVDKLDLGSSVLVA